MLLLKMLGIICINMVFISVSRAQSIDDIPFRIQRLSERVIVINEEWGESPNLVTAIHSEKGIIVIDTQVSQTFASKTRKIIEREFGRHDFLYVINTHDDKDHTGGNQVYGDAEIVAHEECLKALRKRKTRGISTSWNERYIKRLERELAKADTDPGRAEKIRQDIAVRRLSIRDVQSGNVITPPTLTFQDRLTLHLGQLTLRLIYYGSGGHSESDIIIHIPEEKILCMGDLCGPCFPGLSVSDSFKGFNIIDSILQEENGVETVICGHQNTLSKEIFMAKFEYMRQIKEMLEMAKTEGLDFESARQNIVLDTATLNYVSTLAGAVAIQEGHDFIEMLHQEAIQSIWRKMHRSAAAEIENGLSSGEIKSVIQRFKNISGDEKLKYYFDESEFNALGYKLLRDESHEEAVGVFMLNIQFFPESANAYDSLGEAYRLTGDKENAIINYRKSLELNPENNHAAEMLKKYNIIND